MSVWLRLAKAVSILPRSAGRLSTDRRARRAGRRGSVLIRVAACALALAAPPALRAQSAVSALIDRASAYVDEFQHRFGSMVTEERYEDGEVTSQSTAPFAQTFVMRQVTGGRWLNVGVLPPGAGD